MVCARVVTLSAVMLLIAGCGVGELEVQDSEALEASEAELGHSQVSVITAESNLVFGGHAKISASTSRTDRPWARADCYQNGALVFAQYIALYPGVGQSTDTFRPLGPTPSWSGGAANCTVTLLSHNNGSFKKLATTTFNVAP